MRDASMFPSLVHEDEHTYPVCHNCRGVFTVSGLVDAFIYHGSQVIRKKIEIGKFA